MDARGEDCCIAPWANDVNIPGGWWWVRERCLTRTYRHGELNCRSHIGTWRPAGWQPPKLLPHTCPRRSQQSSYAHLPVRIPCGSSGSRVKMPPRSRFRATAPDVGVPGRFPVRLMAVRSSLSPPVSRLPRCAFSSGAG